MQCRPLEIGRLHVVETGAERGPKYVVNFPTKRHWRESSRIEDITEGLQSLVAEVNRRRIRSIAIPPLGCGLGGLEWNDVEPRIQAAFSQGYDGNWDLRVALYRPV